MESFALEAEYFANRSIPVQKYRSTKPGSELTAYFVEVDSQVINGYFCFGIDNPEATGLENLLWHLDSSGGLLPKTMRGDILKPAWQFHGAENPLSDRDQSCYICTTLGDKTFLGAFSCAVLMLENMEHVFHAHGVERKEGEEVIPPASQGHGDVDLESEPKILSDDFYCLSEAGEGAMAWEGTLQLMFPGVKCFQNRLLTPGNGGEITQQMLDCFYKYYRPNNLSVIVTGKLQDKVSILGTLASFEHEYYETHPVTSYTRPWTSDIPKVVYDKEKATSTAHFFPRNPNREPTATVCFGWRGSKSVDIETTMALKVMTAHLAVGPFWTRFVANGLVQRIAWCQLEYADCCSLITMHGITSDDVCDKIRCEIDMILEDLGDLAKDQLKLQEIQAMAERVGWHYVRELEVDPFLILASTISKGERYGLGEKEQMTKRLNPLQAYQELKAKPLDYWRNLIRTYFIDGGVFTTKVVPCAYEGPPLSQPADEVPVQAELAEAQPFISSSRRASSRPRRAASAVGEESNISSLNSNVPIPSTLDKTPPTIVKEEKRGHIEQLLKENAFPFGERVAELEEFKERLKHIAEYIDFSTESEMRFFPIETYRSDEAKQHPLFPVDNMPFFTFLEDIQTSFVYATLVLDTSHLDESVRKLIAPITAALGAVLCPRPPGLDTDSEIKEPNEFNPPHHISDSQVSLGVNGEMIQSIFLMMIVLPENYDWVVGMFHHLLYKSEFTVNFLKFICTEAVKGLAANYRMQTADVPNYDCFDATEINLHSVVNMVYKQDSNARLFVGRRRLDAMNEFLVDLEKDPEGTVKLVAEAWKKIVDEGRFVLQLGTDVKGLGDAGKRDLTAPWRKRFHGIQKSLKFEDSKPIIESQLMLNPGCDGIAVTVNHKRTPCFTTAVPINPSSEDFPKLCIASQLFSMAQKWLWACFGEDDFGMPVLRMPCSYSHILTLNLESPDVLGFFEVMKKIMTEDWEWIDPLMIATKQMVINDPALMDHGPQGTMMISLLSHLSEIPLLARRTLLMESLKVTKEDVKYVIRTYFQKLFDPKQCWYALMSHASDQELIINRLKDLGFNFTKRSLLEVCTQL